jgi:glycosyltransferase involved in cell wall biosynthesis
VPSVYFVVPWYPANPLGGAERLCRRTVQQLRRRGVDARVLTTCVADFRSDWAANALPRGAATVEGVPVERFPADRRDWRLFDQVNRRVMRGEPITPLEAETCVEEGIRSRALEARIADLPGDAALVYMPYLYGTTYWGMQTRPGWLLPCLHDEPYAHAAPFRRLFARARGALCNSAAERELALRLYDLDPARVLAIGTGVDTDLAPDGAPPPLDGPYLLCVARKDHGKNVEGLLADFARARALSSARAELRLVLIGQGTLPLPPAAADRIVDLGFQPEPLKRAAYAGALAHVVPGRHESFSLTLMEAWLCGAPALVSAGCDVTREHVRAAAGGLTYDGAAELGAAVDWLLAHPEAARRMGRNGGEYVRRNFDWDVVVARIRRALGV